MENQYLLWTVAGVIAFIPTFTWIYFLFRKSEEKKGVIAAMFLLGIMTVIPLLLVQYSWKFFPQLNIGNVIPEKIESVYLGNGVMYLIFAMMEEIFKQWLLRFADKKWLLVKSVNDSIKLSIIAALGFSFAENVYPYFFSLLESGDIKSLIGAYFFRSLFTAGAHIFFSGIFGYYYGISKFTSDYRDSEKSQGEKLYFTRFICKIFQIPQDEAYREQKILQGLVIAMGLHGIYNTFLHFNKIIPALIIVLIGFSYLMILLQRSAGILSLVTDISTKKTSEIGEKEKNAIIELIGQYMNEKKYKDVIGICERFLQKDPENNLVKLMKAKAEDTMKGVDLYHEATEIAGTRKEVEDKSTLENLLAQKDRKMPENFQNSPEYQKFLEEEKKKKDKSETFKLEAGSGGPMG